MHLLVLLCLVRCYFFRIISYFLSFILHYGIFRKSSNTTATRSTYLKYCVMHQFFHSICWLTILLAVLLDQTIRGAGAREISESCNGCFDILSPPSRFFRREINSDRCWRRQERIWPGVRNRIQIPRGIAKRRKEEGKEKEPVTIITGRGFASRLVDHGPLNRCRCSIGLRCTTDSFCYRRFHPAVPSGPTEGLHLPPPTLPFGSFDLRARPFHRKKGGRTWTPGLRKG